MINFLLSWFTEGSASPSYKRAGQEKRAGGAHSPATKRKKMSSPAPKKFDKLRRRRTSSSSDSGKGVG